MPYDIQSFELSGVFHCCQVCSTVVRCVPLLSGVISNVSIGHVQLNSEMTTVNTQVQTNRSIVLLLMSVLDMCS